MAQKISDQYGGLFHDDESIYYHQLEKCADSLRACAHNMVKFIDKLQNKTEALKNLKKSYLQIESMPAKNLCHGIEDIKSSLLKVEFLSKNSTIAKNHQDDFIGFFELQNSFNAEVNAFVKKVIQLEMFG
ncbi:MAG: hypothetical protein A3E88_08060 [Legionellales bacterium RIFCSPHIGHO2_12_FULL_35_11]|nr:MAG: hypothetical protein A3E88_08060 [Legionellales bacterium RIFCSPHIGHO2_12_FULL_35_11]